MILRGATPFTATLAVAGTLAAAAPAHGVIAQTPVDRLQVGRDTGGAVGDYPGPFAFPGTIKTVTFTLAPAPAAAH